MFTEFDVASASAWHSMKASEPMLLRVEGKATDEREAHA